MTFWIIAMACGLIQVLQAMTNGSAVKSGISVMWVGAMSTIASTVTLTVAVFVILRLPFPDMGLVMAHGWKTILGGMMGAFIVTGLAFVAPRLGPTQTFLVYFLVIAVASAIIDSFGLLGTEARPLGLTQVLGVALACAGLVLARS